MKSLLEQLAASQDPAATVPFLARLVDALRPVPPQDGAAATSQVHHLIALLRSQPVLRAALQSRLVALLGATRHGRLYCESGILSNDGFFSEGVRKSFHRLLPPLVDETDLKDVVGLVFRLRTDHLWVAAVPEAVWAELFDALFPAGDTAALRTATEAPLLAAIAVLSHRITAIGLEPEITDKLPGLDTPASPLFRQARHVEAWIDAARAHVELPDDALLEPVFVELDRCEGLITELRRRRGELGASLHLTYLLQRLGQNVARLRTLLRLVHPEPAAAATTSAATPAPATPAPATPAAVTTAVPTRTVSTTSVPAPPVSTTSVKVARLLRELVRAENRRHSLGEHLAGNIGLLAYQITEHAGRTGDHYITASRAEWLRMFRSALIGGLVVGFLVWFKTLAYALHLPPFGQSLLYSLNYSLGFVLIHVLHGTIATKQPAMTASKLAASLDARGGRSIEDLAELVTRTARSQFIALVGNVGLAFPVAFLIALAVRAYTGQDATSVEKARQMVDELHPLSSLALPHAALTGVFLFVTGLVSGYYDNKVVYSRIPGRLRQHAGLRGLLGAERLGRFAGYVEQNLGTLCGNVVLGVFLGTTATLGFILGLPLDIRHISFSSGALGLAAPVLGAELTPELLAWSAAGILGIGAMNFSVSFGLATFVAIRSRGVNFRETRQLVAALARRLRRQPFAFLFPPGEAAAPALTPDA